jgi:hypothetical protein
MATVSIVRAPAQPRKPPASPRQPLGWQWDAVHREITITDCDGNVDVYKVLPLAADFGRAFQLIHVGDRFGDYHHVHFSGAEPTCTCPGGTYRGVCKHISSVAALVAGGAL